MKTTMDERPKIDFFERNRKIKHSLVKVYGVTLLLSVIFIVIKGFI